MKEQLEYIFANVSEWLKFAETKNGVMVAVNAGLIVGILSLLCGDPPPPCMLSIYGWYMIAVLAPSLLLCLLSFCPQTQIRKRRPAPPADASHDNLFFFGHARKYEPSEYIAALRAAGSIPVDGAAGSHPNSLDIQLAQQIITNSDIAWWKFWFFKWSLYLLIAAFFTPLIAIAVYFVLDPNKS